MSEAPEHDRASDGTPGDAPDAASPPPEGDRRQGERRQEPGALPPEGERREGERREQERRRGWHYEPSFQAATFRVGVGYDSHRFASMDNPMNSTPLVVAGVRLPGGARVVAHSDGDVVAHAITDAVLGASGLGDIGELFPNDDPANAGRDSMEMLRLAVERVLASGWRVVNVDVAVVCEHHKVGPHRTEMRERLAHALGLPPDAVFVKGKTNERMDAVGRGEGIAAHAVASLVRREATAPPPTLR